MQIADKLFRIKRNIIPIVRGLLKRQQYCLSKNKIIGSQIRIGKGCEFILHPGCSFVLGKKVILGKQMTMAVHSSASILIGNEVGIGPRCQFVCHGRINIGNNTVFGPNVLIYDHNHLYDTQTGVNKREYNIGEVTIGNNCWIGAGAIILMNVHIGNNCVIGAGSIVTKDIPDNSVAVGNPARCLERK